MFRKFCAATPWIAATLLALAGPASAVDPARPDTQSPAGATGDHAHHEAAHPDTHAPIGVMGDHLHHEGGFMLSYRYMRMHMDGNRDGTHREKVSDIIGGSQGTGPFSATPTEMDMQMHMIGGMYAPKDWITLTAMFPVIVLEMEHITGMGQKFTTRSTGLGDISTGALIKLFQTDSHQAHANAAISWPSGSINRKDDTPASGNSAALLPYPMQLGSGTVDLLPGVTYNGQSEFVSWGGQARGTVRLGRNKENYRLGNRYALTAWGAVKPSRWVSAGLRGEWSQWFDIKGNDDRLGAGAPNFIPTADPDRRAGRRFDVGPSIDFLTQEGPLKGVRFGFEMMFPVYQDLDGPQLETDWTLTSGVQYEF